MKTISLASMTHGFSICVHCKWSIFFHVHGWSWLSSHGHIQCTLGDIYSSSIVQAVS